MTLATLEPDYASRIEFPESPVAPLFLQKIEELGADLYTGRKLKILFNKSGLKTEVGIDTETEYIFIKDDKKRLSKFLNQFWVSEKLLEKDGWTKKLIEDYKQEEIKRLKDGLSFCFPPCFYAIGRKE